MNILEILDEIEQAYPQDIFPDTTQGERDDVIERYPGFIYRTSAMMGRHLAKVIREKITADMEWRERYEKRLIERGYLRQDANESADAADNPDNEDPEDSADNEASYALHE
jgi:hypothetical protein